MLGWIRRRIPPHLPLGPCCSAVVGNVPSPLTIGALLLLQNTVRQSASQSVADTPNSCCPVFRDAVTATCRGSQVAVHGLVLYTEYFNFQIVIHVEFCVHSFFLRATVTNEQGRSGGRRDTYQESNERICARVLQHNRLPDYVAGVGGSVYSRRDREANSARDTLLLCGLDAPAEFRYTLDKG